MPLGDIEFSNASVPPYTGAGVTVGLGDVAKVDVDHPEFAGADIVHVTHKPNLEQHTTVDAGHIVAQGVKRKSIGAAPGATLVVGYQSDLVRNTAAYYASHEISITANPYLHGYYLEYPKYTNVSADVDQQMFDNPRVLHMFAAGNASHKMVAGGASSKNALTVGNGYISGPRKNGNPWKWDTYDNDGNPHRYDTSSRGPTLDGRIKPEVLALGMGLDRAPGLDNKYKRYNGTSQAVSNAAAFGALITEAYHTLYSESGGMPSAWLKNIICNTADDLYYETGKETLGPDNLSGFGVINVGRAIDNLTNSIVGTAGSCVDIHYIPVPSDVSTMKIMLTWLDPPGASYGEDDEILVNLLQLKAAGEDPYIAPMLPNAELVPAMQAADTRNNIQQCKVDVVSGSTAFVEVHPTTVVTENLTYYLTWCFE